jgi:hypothetical protein
VDDPGPLVLPNRHLNFVPYATVFHSFTLATGSLSERAAGCFGFAREGAK